MRGTSGDRSTPDGSSDGHPHEPHLRAGVRGLTATAPSSIASARDGEGTLTLVDSAHDDDLSGAIVLLEALRRGFPSAERRR